MLYRKNGSPSLAKELFQNPTSEYRGAPFWSWNCKVNKEDIDHTLEDLHTMGMGGAHIHCRTGMDLPYLGKEFMDMVHYSHEKSNSLDMITWLYDEDRWPSGAAGGLVTKNPDYRMRFLVFSPEELPEKEDVKSEYGGSSAQPVSSGNRRFLAKYAVRLENGYLASYQLLAPDTKEPEGSDIWYLYREIAGNDPWYNNQAYVDTLNPRAIDRFIELTHEAYYRELGESFGDTVPAIFTDEPQFCHKQTLGFAEEKKKVILPFTDDFPETYEKAYGCNFFESFPECIWELPEGAVSVNRYHYHDHICERFATAFADNIGGWCRNHNIALTGHMMEEPTLMSQTAALGEAMRSYRSFDLPGIDMLCDWRELTTAKQAQSAVHQFGYEGMLSELYGVTNWNFDFRGHKLAGDWQAALGVTIRVHHLTWTSMAGEAKRDYPAAIGYQSPWYRKYSMIEDYFGRLNTALTRGTPEVKVGVIHPVESYWLYWGAKEQTDGIRQEMDYNFHKLTEWLLYGLIDFDFISESLWKDQTPDEALDADGDLMTGKMKYDVIVVPNCVTIRRSTLKRLMAFRKRGGRVIFTGTIPSHVDALLCGDASDFADTCEKIGFAENLLLSALLPARTVDVHNQLGVRTDNLIYQMRNDNGSKWLFLAHCRPMANPDIPQREELTIKISGAYRPVLYDAMTGEIREVPYRHVKDAATDIADAENCGAGCATGYRADCGTGCSTIIEETVYDHDSLLYLLVPEDAGNSSQITAKARETAAKTQVLLPAFMDISLEEPNVRILDIAEAKFDDGDWQAPDEVLRIDNKFREILGYQLRMDAFPQPWVFPDSEEIRHKLSLRFRIDSEIAVKAPLLALEQADKTRLYLNGQEVASEINGYFTDRSIQTVTLPDLQPGENILIAEMPYYNKFNVEAMYLLGDFGVKVAGRCCMLTPPVQRLAFGDICTQGLPFYGASITYKVPVTVSKDCRLNVSVTQFRCPVMSVALDGRDCGNIALSPYELTIPNVSAGEHLLEITAFGNRINSFGTLHNCNHTETWIGPNAWRTTGPEWAYEYQLHEIGILVSPVVTEI